MKLSTAYARFYKSFNFDHARKLNVKIEKQPWEDFRDSFYPYVTIPIDPKITTVVGANESGKSHLLSVIKKAITGIGIEHRDLCRYSPFFGVAQGQTCWPHVGVGWELVSSNDAAAISDLVQADNSTFDRFLMFREEPQTVNLWLPDEDNQWTRFSLDKKKTSKLEEIIPKPFEINSEIALPNSIPFSFLSNGEDASAASMSRAAVEKMIDAVTKIGPVISGGAPSIQQNAQNIFDTLNGITQTAKEAYGSNEIASLELGRSLLLMLGEIDPNGLIELANAIDQQQDGYVGGLLNAVNQQLEKKMNFQRYWVQDRDFTLKVATRDRELVFIISDRTGTVYTFSERSSGLRYFLSYLIQAQIHRPEKGQESILLMDEPDTYLSAEAQQDLMRVFRDLAEPPTETDPIQVVYVTHSPFLLDKNHSERIRVLEKGTGFDGTRVVPNVSRNHYEPLRSAFGAFVGESAFVGSVNVLVEGAADQIILAGAANLIRSQSPNVEDDTLDLNRLVIVPCGSAGEVSYTVYRIRGQGAEKPPVVVLFDADSAGKTAAKQFKTDKRLKKLIPPSSVLILDEVGAEIENWPKNPELEDLLPLTVVHLAVEHVLREVTKFRDGKAPTITLKALKDEADKNDHIFDAINVVLAKSNGRVDKIAFAKAVVQVCKNPSDAVVADVNLYLDHMRVLFRAVNRAVRGATDDAASKNLELIVNERAELFRIDNPTHATREQGRIVLDQIGQQLDDSVEAEAIRNAALTLRTKFHLHDDPGERISEYELFLDGLVGLKHAWRVESAES